MPQRFGDLLVRGTEADAYSRRAGTCVCPFSCSPCPLVCAEALPIAADVFGLHTLGHGLGRRRGTTNSEASVLRCDGTAPRHESMTAETVLAHQTEPTAAIILAGRSGSHARVASPSRSCCQVR